MTQLAFDKKYGFSGQSYLRSFVALSAFALLSACGGGGSSSGGGATPTPAPTPTPPPAPTGAGLVLPDVVMSAVQENFASSDFDSPEFDVSGADTSLEPVNFRLIGADATNFQIFTTIRSTASPDVFRVELDLGNTEFFDFENPADANGDNIYSFDYVFDYGETTYMIPVEIAVENVREDFPIDGSLIRLEFEPTNAEVVADVTGDSLSDLILLENEERFFTAGVYILSSETVAESIGRTNIVTDDELHANFNPANDGRENLTAQPSVDGVGFDLLYSNSFSDRYVYYDVNSLSDAAFLSGEVDPADAANNGTNYVHADVSAGTDTQIIHDVNLDGQNDIFSFDIFSGEMGIRFGTAGNGLPDQSSTPDIVITNDDFTGIQPEREIRIATAPDLDGDGNRELMILSSFYLAQAGNDGSGAVWIINSSFLATNPASIDLVDDATNGLNVRRISGGIDQRFGESFTELTDGDGNPFLLFGTGEANENQGLIGVTLPNLTSLAQLSDASSLAAVGVTYVLGTGPSNGGVVNEPIGAVRPISDFDADGQTDFLSLNSILVPAAALLAGADVIGGEHEIDVSTAPRLKRDAGSFGSDNIVYLADQDIIAFSQGNTDGEYLLVSGSDIAEAVAADEGDVLVNILPE